MYRQAGASGEGVNITGVERHVRQQRVAGNRCVALRRAASGGVRPASRRGQPQLAQYVRRVVHQLGALFNQYVAAFGQGRVDQAGDGRALSADPS